MEGGRERGGRGVGEGLRAFHLVYMDSPEMPVISFVENAVVPVIKVAFSAITVTSQV